MRQELEKFGPRKKFLYHAAVITINREVSEGFIFSIEDISIIYYFPSSIINFLSSEGKSARLKSVETRRSLSGISQLWAMESYILNSAE